MNFKKSLIQIFVQIFGPFNVFVVAISLASIAAFLIVACPREAVIEQFAFLGTATIYLLALAGILDLIKEYKSSRKQGSEDGES